MTARIAGKGPTGGRAGRRKGGGEVLQLLMLERAVTMAPGELTIRNLAKEAGVAPRMSMYVFGSLTGLLLAVADRGFSALNAELEAAYAASVGRSRLKDVAMSYLRFGLDHEVTWRHLHSPALWSVIQDPNHKDRAGAADGTWAKSREEEAIGETADRADRVFDPFEVVVEARGVALNILTKAAMDSGCDEPAAAAHAVACLVDGILWQIHFERVANHLSPDQRLTYFERFIDRGIAGWRE